MQIQHFGYRLKGYYKIVSLALREANLNPREVRLTSPVVVKIKHFLVPMINFIKSTSRVDLTRLQSPFSLIHKALASLQHSLFAHQLQLAKLDTIDPLITINKIIDFSALALRVDTQFPIVKNPLGGRPPYPTEMVFVWSKLTDGDPLFTLSQVALNDSIMIFAFAPIVDLLLGISSITVPMQTLIISVVMYIVIPVIISQIIRYFLINQGSENALQNFINISNPWSVIALLLTIILLFSFQGKVILAQPLVIFILAVPIIIQVLFNSSLAYWLNKKLGEKHNVACPSALIASSNFFELAVAAAISLFGFESGASLATVIGVLIEVPLMLFVVRIVNQTKNWYGE